METNTTPTPESNPNPSYPPGSLQEFFDNTPEKWTQHDYARDKNGRETSIFDPEATCFCLLGGISKVYNVTVDDLDDKTLEIREKINEAIRKLFPDRPSYIHKFNDHPDTTFEDIKKVLKEANV